MGRKSSRQVFASKITILDAQIVFFWYRKFPVGIFPAVLYFPWYFQPPVFGMFLLLVLVFNSFCDPLIPRRSLISQPRFVSCNFVAKTDTSQFQYSENDRKFNARRFRDHFGAAFFSEIPFFILSRPGSGNFEPKIAKPFV